MLGWLRGEPGHCRMVAIPPRRMPGDRDASARGWSPNGPGCVNTIKAELALWGIQGFKPGLKKAAEHLEALRTVEGGPCLPTHWPSCTACWSGGA